MKEDIPKKVKVTQIRGTGRRTQAVRATISALGLGKIGKTKVHPVNAAVVGMLRKVEHLIKIEPAE